MLKYCWSDEQVNVSELTQIMYHMKVKTRLCRSALQNLFGEASIQKLSFKVAVFSMWLWVYLCNMAPKNIAVSAQ